MDRTAFNHHWFETPSLHPFYILPVVITLVQNILHKNVRHICHGDAVQKNTYVASSQAYVKHPTFTLFY
jgi:hypothetical protein